MTERATAHRQSPAAESRMEPLAEAELGWRRQHGEIVRYGGTEEAGAPTWQEAQPLKLDRYLGQGRITETQHAAGEQFRELWLAAGREPHSTLDYSPLRGRAVEVSDARAAADRRCRDAERAVPGVCRLAVMAVCCWDQHAPIKPLDEGLRALAGFFGLSRGARTR